MSDSRVVVTVIGPDRVGIVADVAGLLSKQNVNILDINQKVMGGNIFAMTMLTDITTAVIDFGNLKKLLEEKGKELGLKIHAQHEDIFKYMHRI
ncbi:MAG: ACT domain-containing protein [Deltaproteobacteria bacterium]